MHLSSRIKVALLVTSLLLGLELVPSVLAQQQGYEPPHQKPGPASERIHFQSFHVDLAGVSLQAGDMDMYIFSLKTEAARQLIDVPDINVYKAPATMISLILNPAPAPEGQLNPFSIKEVRSALQYVVNRRFITQEIYKGLAEPMLAHVGPFDYDYLTIYDDLKKQDITYDPDFAQQLVREAMTQAGAVMTDGLWHFNDFPIHLNFIVRVEDERKEVGDLIRAELQKLGFSVNPTYQSFAPAILTVYGSDPQLFQWHLYTEGWGRGAADRYDYGTINSMAAPWLGNMPGWQETGFWQYENVQLDDIGKRIFQGNFQSPEERDQLYREMTHISIDESIRIWLATIVNSLPASDEIVGITQDISAGPKSIWTLREAYIPGSDTLTVGNLWVWTERSTWNPIGGFGDVYSNDIWQNLHDPPLWRDPFTGIPLPFRATYDVTTAGPANKLDVPADALLWSAERDAFVPVRSGVKATSKVVFDYSLYFQSNWHNGQPITMADVIYSIQQTFDLALDEDKSRIEFALAITSRPFLQTVRGFRVLDENRLEVYVDYWHFVDDYIAEYASISGLSMPWEIMAAMDKLVFEDRRAAYSNTAAQRFNVPWISLVMSNDTRLVRRALLDMLDRDAYPSTVFEVGGTTLATQEDARQRYQATLDWIEEHGMAVISNGPYQLERFDPPAQFAEIVAFRDPTYPFTPGDWYRGVPPAIGFEILETAGIDTDSAATINLSIQGPGQVQVRYLLKDAVTGQIIAQGEAQHLSDNQYTIELSSQVTSSLTPGPHSLFVIASSDQVSSLAERRLDVQVTSGEVTPLPPPAASPTATPTSIEDDGGGGFSCSGPPLDYLGR